MPNPLLSDPAIAQRAHDAHRRGIPLLWHGEHAERERLEVAADFDRGIVSLTPHEVLEGARAALASEQTAAADGPILPGQIYEGVPNHLLAGHCLDRRGAWGVAGWPVEDALQAVHHQVPPDRRTLSRMLAAIDADQSLEVIEHILAEEPVLGWRFLRHANSALFGRRDGVESVRQGMMVLGMTNLRRWVGEQLPGAVDEPDLAPVRRAAVVRTQLLEQMLEPGDEDRLRNEIQLCGLLAQIGALVGESTLQAVHGLPLSERVLACVLQRDGPYAPYLALAEALEFPHMGRVPALCEQNGIDIADVNRATLRVLANAQLYPARAT